MASVIIDCAWHNIDGTCEHPANKTPECHIWACRLLSPDVVRLVDSLLDALKAVVEVLGDHQYSPYAAVVEQARAAIAQAEAGLER